MSEAVAWVTALAREVEADFPGTTTELSTFPSGAVHLDVRQSDRVLVLAYIPSQDWYGVDELLPDDGLETSYRHGAADFPGARDALLRLLRGE
jgi:hypothetical protein